MRTIVARSEEMGLNPATMVSIAICESGLKINALNINKNKTKDRGIFQLNSVHNKRLSQMRLNPDNYLDNINYALFLAKTEGLRHWSASTKCWKPRIALNST